MSILPIDPDVLESMAKEEEDEKKVKMVIADVSPEEPEEIDEAEVAHAEAVKEEIFEKPVEISKKTGKPKRQLTESQKANLAKAREKSAAKRKALKDAKALEKAEKKLKREAISEEKIKKQEEDESRIRLAAQLKLDAEKSSHWSEDRIAKLMEKTLDNYIAKKKKMKPMPRESIPYKAESKPLPSPQVQRQQQQQQHRPSQQYYQQPYRDPTPHYQQYNNNRQEASVMNTLFGNFTDN